MHIVFLTNGTRGDIQPLIYLGQGLKVEGHTVCLTASENFRDLIKDAGLEHHPMPVMDDPGRISYDGRHKEGGKHAQSYRDTDDRDRTTHTETVLSLR